MMLTTEVPDNYKCANCGATGCKLWREYQRFSPQLLCLDCAAADQGKDISDIDENGMRTRESGPGRTEQIGWYVPAIPNDFGTRYLEYPDNIPIIAMEWWRALPNRP
ncbi:MAG: hypothetical protein R3251_00815 [Candidatus Spechtbacterales bacterium]|nr:hypothetical protein [Candidatus Spechtbacterales bacterium]